MWFGSFEIAVLLPNEALRVERLKIGPASPQQARRVEAAVRHLVMPSITLLTTTAWPLLASRGTPGLPTRLA
jgi:hypothetical protein